MGNRLQRVVNCYNLGRLSSARPIKHGFVNTSWAVETCAGRYFLKRRHPDLCDPSTITAQHALIDHLRRRQFPSPCIVPTATGASFLQLEGQVYELHRYIEGRLYDHGLPKDLAEAALTLGHYHNLVRGFSHPALRDQSEKHTPANVSVNLARLVEAWRLEQDSRMTHVVRQLEDQAQDTIARSVGYDALPHLVIHGDYYADNLIFCDDRIAGVVDFDKAHWQARVSEVAEALIYFASPRPGRLAHLVYPGVLDWQPFERFLIHYARASVLDTCEIEALPTHIRLIWLAVSLRRLVESGPRPPQATDSLREVLTLGEWARVNAGRMAELAHTASHTKERAR